MTAKEAAQQISCYLIVGHHHMTNLGQRAITRIIQKAIRASHRNKFSTKKRR